MIAEGCNEVAAETTQHQRGTEGTAYASAADGGGCGHRLEQNEHKEDCQGYPAVVAETVEHTAGEEGVVIAPVEEFGECPVALAVEGREKEYHDAEDDAAYYPLGYPVLATAEPFLHFVGAAQKIDRTECAEDAQYYQEWYLAEREVLRYMEDKLHFRPHEKVGNGGRRQRRDEQGHCCGHRHVEHEHLDREQHTGQGGFEDARNGSGGAASQKQFHAARADMEEPPYIGADGTARGGNGGLESHAAAECHGEG